MPPPQSGPSAYSCSNCHGSIGKWSPFIQIKQAVAESWGGEGTQRLGREVLLDAAVCCSWPCVASYVAEHHSDHPARV